MYWVWGEVAGDCGEVDGHHLPSLRRRIVEDGLRSCHGLRDHPGESTEGGAMNELHDYEQRIIELRAALRWIREAAALVPPDAAAETLTRIQQHAVVALLHDAEVEIQR